MALFQRGFGKYLQSGEFADVILVYGDTEFRAHKIVLAYSSEFFARLLSGTWKETILDRVELKQPDPAGVFPAVLRFMYTGTISFSIENASPILALADQYLIGSLRQLATNYLSKAITRENVFELLPNAIAFQTDSVVDKCVNCIAKNFYFMKADQDYNFLPLHIYKQLLQHPYLAVKDEWLLYQAVCRYIVGHNELVSDQVLNLLESIRYRWMTYEQLQQVESNTLVPRALIVEAVMARLKVHEGQNAEELEESDNPRLKKRTLAGLEFEYTSDFDDKGIIYWIATHGGREPWVNPHNAGWIRVTASSIEKGNPPDLVSRDRAELWTKDVPASWFTIDLMKRTVLPTHYTLRHGPFKADSLRTWDLQGSQDGQNWHVLRRHATDKTLNGNWATHTWPLPGLTRAFRYFRILQTGRNSNNHNFLVLSGFELYGVVYETA